jgi:Trypsin-like peptidase domain
MRISCVSSVLLSILLNGGPVEALNDDQLKDITRATVHVLCDLPSGDTQGGSGFVYNRPNQIVTSFHVVAAASNSNVKLHVFSTAARLDRSAKVVRVLKAADLALLELDESLGLPTLTSNDANLSFGDDLIVFGHPLFTPTVQRQTVKFDTEEPLKNITPLAANQEISRLGMPSIDISIFGLMGPLVPGHSGAPIVDRNGNVVAIGDGGLERGAASISWAIPARELHRLLNSNDAVTVGNDILSAMKVLFAAELNSNLGASQSTTHAVSAGPVILRKMRKRTLGEIRRSLTNASDDPLGLLQLLQPLLVPGIQYNPDQLAFDIYQDETSGMNLVLPSNILLRANGNNLIAQSQGGNIEWFVSASRVNSDMETQQASSAFELQIVDMDHSVNWQIDPAWSYGQLRQTPDGMLIMRKHFTGYVFAPQTGFTAAKILFETFAKRGDYLLSAAVIRSGADQPGALPQNDPVWASAILGIHLSSFSR